MPPVVIKFGGYQQPASIHNRAAARFGEALARELGAGVRFELVGNVLELGRKSGDLRPMVERGELSCCYLSTVRFTEAAPELRILELPFVVRDRAAAMRALGGEFGDHLKRRIGTATQLRVLGFWDNGIRHLSNRVRPIRTPADCRGLRIRTQMSALHGETFRALGFEPIAADVKELVEQIATDRFQAQDNPLTNIYNFGVHRHHRYITLSGHFFGASVFVCNSAHFAGWPAEVRRAVDDAAREATAYQHELAAAEDTEILARLDPRENEVIRLTAPERAAFIDAVRPVLDRHRGEFDPRFFAYLEA